MSNLVNSLNLAINASKGYNPYRNADGTFANGPSAMDVDTYRKFRQEESNWKKQIYSNLNKVDAKATTALQEAEDTLNFLGSSIPVKEKTTHANFEKTVANNPDNVTIQQLGTKSGQKMLQKLRDKLNSYEFNGASFRPAPDNIEKCIFTEGKGTGTNQDSLHSIKNQLNNLKSASKQMAKDKDYFVKRTVRLDKVTPEFASKVYDNATAAMATKAAAVERLIEGVNPSK